MSTTDMVNACRDLSDEYLRKNYWYYLRDAKLALKEELTAHNTMYQLGNQETKIHEV